MTVCLSVRPSVRPFVFLSVRVKNSAPTGQIFVKLYICGVLEISVGKINFGENLTRVMDTLYEELCICVCVYLLYLICICCTLCVFVVYMCICCDVCICFTMCVFVVLCVYFL